MPSDLLNIVVEGGFDNGTLDVDLNKYDNRTNRCDVLLDVGHHFHDCPHPRVRFDMAQDQFLENKLPREVCIDILREQNKITRPQPIGSTTTNN